MKKINFIKTIIGCFVLFFIGQTANAQCTINFENDGDVLFGDIMPNSGDIVNFDAPMLDAGCFNVLDENLCTCPLAGGGGADDVCLSFEIEPIIDIYGGITTPYDGGVALQITHETTGIRGTIPMGDAGARDVSTGDVICYSVTVDFADHLIQRACDVRVNTTSINTFGEGYESTSITFLDAGDVPYGVATYNGFYDNSGGGHPGVVASCPATQPAINPTPWTSTGTGVWIADNTGTTVPLAGDACEYTAGASGPDNNGDPSGVDAGLMPCDPVGGFIFRVCLENVETATADGIPTPIATTFTSTLNGFDAVLSCCPDTNLVVGTSSMICELGTEITDWKAVVETVGPTGGISTAPVAPTTVSYLYSSNGTYAGTYTATAYAALQPFDAEPSHVHSGLGCVDEMETTYAYVICDKGAAACADGTVCETEQFEISLVSDIDLTFYPPAQLPTITRDDDACVYTITPACPTDVLSPSTFGPETPGVDPPAFSVTVTTANGCTNMVMLDPEACPLPAVPSIAIDKDDADNIDDIQTVSGGDATFTITVTNDGTVPLENIIITDALSPGCDMDATMTSAAIMAVGNADAILDPMESFTYTCTTTGGVTGSFTNSITVDGNAVGDPGATVTATDVTDVIFECPTITVEALPSCPAVGTDFNIDISNITGGTTGGTYTVDGGGLSVSYPGATIIGPFTYADQNTKITLTITDDATGCIAMYDVLQLNCESQEVCDCSACPNGTYNINTQAAGNGNGFSMLYVLTDPAGAVLAVNTTGNFPGLDDNTVYSVYAINVADGDLATMQGAIAVGAPFDPADAAFAGLCFDASCSAMFTEDCGCEPVLEITCPAEINLCGDPVALNLLDSNPNTTGSSIVVYGGTCAAFIDDMGTADITDDVIDPSLASALGTYNLTITLTSADGCTAPEVECFVVFTTDCEADGGQF